MDNEEFNGMNENEQNGTEENTTEVFEEHAEEVAAAAEECVESFEDETVNTETDTEVNTEAAPEVNTEVRNESNTVYSEQPRVQRQNLTYETGNYYSNIPVYTEEEPKEKKKKGGGFWKAATAVLLALCLITSSFAIGTILGRDKALAEAEANKTESTSKAVTVSTPEYTPTTQSTADGRLDIPGVVAKVSPSVVVITTKSDEGGSLATGVIYTEDGYIITCAHVVDDANSVSVYLYGDEKTSYPAEVIGFDSYTDIGVIKVDLTGLPAAEFGESHKLVPGEQVVSIGNPYEQEVAYTVTDGIVSARRDDYNIEDLNLTLDLIQHTATINPGNSGGPLINMYGQVVGINSVKIMSGDYETYEDIGFAVQMETALPIVEQIISQGKVSRPQIGIKGATESTLGGIYVAEVVKGGAAEKADIQVGDIITKLNGERVKSIEELIAKLGKLSIGDEVEITLLRDVDVVVTKLVLQAPSED